MEQKNIIIICATLIVIVAIICGTVYLTSVKDTNLSISDTKVTKGDKITISLVDSEGNPLVNKNITINVTDSKNKTKSYNVTTNNKGKYKFKVKLSKGKYVFNIEYKGELLLKSSNITKKVTVKEKEVPKKATTSYSSSYNIYADTSPEGLARLHGRVYDEKTGKTYVARGGYYDGASDNPADTIYV